MPTVPIFKEREIPDSHRNIFIVKTQSLFVDLRGKLISNIFSGIKMDFRFREKSQQLALMASTLFGSSENFLAVFQLPPNILKNIFYT